MPTTLRLALLALTTPSVSALYWTPYSYTDVYSLYSARADVEPVPSPHWTVSADAYELKVRLPDLEPMSVRAALGIDGTKVEVIGERKIDGCQCQPSTVKEIALPYRPRVEDVDVALGKDGVLALRLARQPAKAESTTPLTVSVASKEADATETRPLRFVPHESAQAKPAVSPLEEQEKSLSDKFRSAALAAVAVAQHDQPSAKEAAAATAEGAAAVEHAPPPAEPAAAADDAAAPSSTEAPAGAAPANGSA